MISTIIAILTSLATVVGLLATIQSHFNSMRSAVRSNVVIVGIPAGVQIPDYFKRVPDFTNYRKAISSGEKIVLLHTKNVSSALKICDFVLVTTIADPQLIVLDTDYGENRAMALIDGE